MTTWLWKSSRVKNFTLPCLPRPRRWTSTPRTCCRISKWWMRRMSPSIRSNPAKPSPCCWGWWADWALDLPLRFLLIIWMIRSKPRTISRATSNSTSWVTFPTSRPIPWLSATYRPTCTRSPTRRRVSVPSGQRFPWCTNQISSRSCP